MITNWSADNWVSLIIAVIVAMTTIYTARFSRREMGDDTRRKINALRVQLAECEHKLGEERQAFFAERQLWAQPRKRRRKAVSSE